MTQQPPQWQPQPGPYVDYSSIVAPRTSGMAIASMVVGIVGVVTACFLPILPGLVALILGLVGLGATGENKMRGRGFAVTGVVLGAVALVASIILPLSILLPSLGRAREAANRIKCSSNMRQIGQAIRQYAIDNDGQFPPNLEVLMSIDTLWITGEVMLCPSTTHSAGASDAPLVLGQNLSFIYVGQGLTDDLDVNYVLLYEPVENHDRDGANFLFSDGSVRFIPRQQARPMIQQLEQGINPPDENAPVILDDEE